MARTNAKHSQAFRMDRMRRFLSHLRAAEIELRTLLERVGIDDALIAEGEALYLAAHQAAQTKGEKEADLAQVREDLNTARTTRVGIFRRQRRRAKEDIEDVRVRELLHLNDQRVLRQAWLHSAMERFYAAGLEHAETHGPLASVGITIDVLRAGHDAVQEIERLDALEERICIEKVSATGALRQALDRMDAWRLDRLEEATFATRHKPELMKIFGRKPRRRR